MEVVVLSVPDCPNATLLSHRLQEVLVGRNDVRVSHQVVQDDDKATKTGMHGSPTLLIDGIDPFASLDIATSFSCRLYHDDDGRIHGAPSVEQLRRVFEGRYVTKSTQAVGSMYSLSVDTAPLLPAVRHIFGGTENSRLAPHKGGQRTVQHTILRHFAATGQPPSAATLDQCAIEAGTSISAALATLEKNDFVRLDGDGRLVVAYPFSAAPTPHKVQLGWNGITVFAMCAVDALGMGYMLSMDTIVLSITPDTGETVTVSFHDGHSEWTPPTAVVVAGVAGEEGPASKVCCLQTNIFTDMVHAQAWTKEHRDITSTILLPQQAEHLAQRAFSSLLATDAV